MRAYRVTLEHKNSRGWEGNWEQRTVIVSGGAAAAIRAATKGRPSTYRAESVELVADDSE